MPFAFLLIIYPNNYFSTSTAFDLSRDKSPFSFEVNPLHVRRIVPVLKLTRWAYSLTHSVSVRNHLGTWYHVCIVFGMIPDVIGVAVFASFCFACHTVIDSKKDSWILTVHSRASRYNFRSFYILALPMLPVLRAHFLLILCNLTSLPFSSQILGIHILRVFLVRICLQKCVSGSIFL